MTPEVSTVGGDQSVDELRRELAEAREQQAATAEILAAISNSPTDPNCVFAEIPASAARLCEAHNAAIFQLAGDHLRFIGSHGPLPNLGPIGQAALPLTRGSLVGRAVNDKKTIHVADVQADTAEYPEGCTIARRLGYRTMVAIPLMRAGEAIGAITIRRADVRPFTDRQIELLKTFADQVVIAIENARLFSETREALARQTATADILRVISQSPTDVQPVFDAIVRTAVRLLACDAAFVMRCDASSLSVAAWARPDGLMADTGYSRQGPIDPTSNFPSRVIEEKRLLHQPDWSAIDLPKHERKVRAKFGVNSALYLPLLRNGACIGVLSFARNKVGAFSEKEIALAESFRDQAVIAIENTRLFEEVQARTRELTQSLEQQTATSEVLGVISSSPGALQPVFETMLSNAVRICEAKFGNLLLYEGDVFRYVAMHGAPPAFAELRQRNPVVPTAGILARIAATKQVQHVADITTEQPYLNRHPPALELADVAGARTLLGVPMLTTARRYVRSVRSRLSS